MKTSIKIPKINTAAIVKEARKFEPESKFAFKFEDGMVIRLLPYKHSENPFIGVYMKYFNKTMLYSPQNFGMPDPFFEAFNETGDKNLKPTMRFFCPCIIRGKERSGLKFASLSQTQYLKLISFLEEVDLFDIEEGHDINVKVTNKGGTMKEIDFIYRAKATPAYIDMNYIEELYENQPNFLEDIVRPRLKSYEELKNILYHNHNNDNKDVKKESSSEFDNDFESNHFDSNHMYSNGDVYITNSKNHTETDGKDEFDKLKEMLGD